MDKELEFIKLKTDWYKSLYPWNLALIVGSVAFIRVVEHERSTAVVGFLITSVIFLLLSLIFMGQAALTLIHRLEPPYISQSALFRLLSWIPRGPKWEAFFAFASSICLGAGYGFLVLGLVLYAAT